MNVGIVGWRGMVGSVLLERMRAEGDFSRINTTFFSTSQAGQPGPDVGQGSLRLADAGDLKGLAALDAIISCQGGDYTKQVHTALRAAGFDGYWIDAASALRMDDKAVIILDPVNRAVIDDALDRGVKDFVGGNCTVSLMLMAMAGLVDRGWVEWINVATYQAASGGGARHMRELVAQMRALGAAPGVALDDAGTDILAIDRSITAALGDTAFPTEAFGVPLAGSLIPWIDTPMGDGQTREEWKGHVETNKILGLAADIAVDGVCVRIGAMRSHAQAITIKMREDVPLADIEAAIAGHNEWVRLVANDKDSTLAGLSPAAVSGTLEIAVGRVRKLRMGPEYVSLFTVGDQLLWGAAEPLRRMLRILLDRA
ncbi:MAG: aspartate-semialdehyde dehydrogenase [Hyphomicrobiaceae bacterium]|jgi:aspartate-semialdehyde dehydrogenase